MNFGENKGIEVLIRNDLGMILDNKRLDIFYKSSDDNIATISNGIITAKSSRVCEISIIVSNINTSKISKIYVLI